MNDAPLSATDAHTEDTETARKPAPALTDEQIDSQTDVIADLVSCDIDVLDWDSMERFWSWLAAVIDRAKRKERSAIADAARTRYGYQSKIATWIESEATDDETC